jgi:hypothetical protein
MIFLLFTELQRIEGKRRFLAQPIFLHRLRRRKGAATTLKAALHGIEAATLRCEMGMMRNAPLMVLNLNESNCTSIALVPLMLNDLLWKVLNRLVRSVHLFFTIENSLIYLFYSKIQPPNKYFTDCHQRASPGSLKYSGILRYNIGNERKRKDASIR